MIFVKCTPTRSRQHLTGVRLSLSDFVEGALGYDDACAFARLLERSGDVDFVDVTGASYHNSHLEERPSDAAEDGWLVEPAAAVKEAAPGLAVFVGGGPLPSPG